MRRWLKEDLLHESDEENNTGAVLIEPRLSEVAPHQGSFYVRASTFMTRITW
jgi:hypothetical protein